MILNPTNEEAVYYLAKLKLITSDYKKSKELNKRLKSICRKFCDKSDELKVEIENLSKNLYMKSLQEEIGQKKSRQKLNKRTLFKNERHGKSNPNNPLQFIGEIPLKSTSILYKIPLKMNDTI